MASADGVEKLEDVIVRSAEQISADIRAAREAIATVIFGQERVVENALVTILSGGHALLIGVPGLAKTKLVEAMGTVRRRQGTGTFVTKRDNAISVMTIGGFADTYASRTDHMTRQVKRAEVTTADAETAAALHVEPGAPVFALERVFLLDGVPISIDRSAYSLDRFPDFDKRVDAETSTYRVLREEYGVEFAEVRRDLRIGFTTPESAEWLQRPANEPLLVTDKVALDRDGQVIHTSRIEYPPSRVALRTVAYADHPPEQPQS